MSSKRTDTESKSEAQRLGRLYPIVLEKHCLEWKGCFEAEKALLKQVCADAEDEGLDYVEAYINKEFSEESHDFRGPLELYLKCGFVIAAERDGRVVVRKPLK